MDGLLNTAKAEHVVQEQFDVLVCQPFGFIPKVMGQFAATEVDMGIAFPTGSLADLFVQLLDEGILFVSFPQGFASAARSSSTVLFFFLVIVKSSFLVLKLGILVSRWY